MGKGFIAYCTIITVSQTSMDMPRSALTAPKTGITGRYHLALKWVPDDSADSGPSLFTALEEQLGLKLVPAKGPVEVLVIDRAEMPTAN